jgi:hypothetical protein
MSPVDENGNPIEVFYGPNGEIVDVMGNPLAAALPDGATVAAPPPAPPAVASWTACAPR